MQIVWNNLSDAIFHYGKIRPDAVALVDGPQTISYAEFAALVGSTCLYLLDLGIGVDDRVGLALDNHAEHFMLAFALMRIGAIPVEIPLEISDDKQHAIIESFAIATVFVESDSLAVGLQVKRVVVGVHWRRNLQGKEGDYRIDRSAMNNKLVMLTSWGGGRLEAVVTTHRQRIMRFRDYAELFRGCWSEHNPGNALLMLSISNPGMHQLLINQILFGGTVHILPSFARFQHCLKAIAAYQQVVLFATANLCRLLLANRDQNSPFLPNLQLLVAIGLPLTATEKQQIYTHITPTFLNVYGASGFGIIAGLQSADLMLKAESVGRAAPQAEIQIVDAQGRLLPTGSVGHLRCRSASMAESIQIVNPEVRGESTLIQNDWFYSGDLASVDAEGYLYLKGRKSDLIIRGDVEIYPDDIESAFKVLPQIRDVGVVGVKANDESGEMPVVAIVSDEKFRAEFWASFFSVSLTVEQRPVRIIYVNSISRTPGGEIDRFALRQQVLNRLRAADKQTGLQIFA